MIPLPPGVRHSTPRTWATTGYRAGLDCPDMTRILRTVCITALAAGMTTIAAAQAMKVNAKPGLWEMSVQVTVPGMPSVDTSKMPPQQKAMMESMMAGGRGLKPVQSCVTREDLDQGRVQKDPPGSECTTKIINATSSLVEMTQTCTGQAAGTREMRLETTPETMKMVAKTVTGRGAGTVATITGKWLSASCGNVK